MKQKLSQRFAAPLPISADTRPLLGNREMASILTLSDCSRVTGKQEVVPAFRKPSQSYVCKIIDFVNEGVGDGTETCFRNAA
jgi:hypothetical protein